MQRPALDLSDHLEIGPEGLVRRNHNSGRTYPVEGAGYDADNDLYYFIVNFFA